MTDDTTAQPAGRWIPTADECEEIFLKALRAGDTQGIVAALTVMAPRDPRRAQELLEAVNVGLTIAKEAGKGTTTTDAATDRARGRLVIVCGLPASGKTTWTRRYVDASPFTRIRSNRDDRRRSQWGGRTGDPRHEDATTAAQHAEIRAWLRDGWEVIVDDTNLNPAIAHALTSLGWEMRVDVEIQDFTYIGVETCIDRDTIRAARGEPHVGEEVIRSMHAEWLAGRIKDLRRHFTDAVSLLYERSDILRREGLHDWSNWREEASRVFTVDHASQVLVDEDLRGSVEQVAKLGRRLGMSVELVDLAGPRVLDGLPTLEAVGGSFTLRDLLSAGVDHVTFRPVGVNVVPGSER